MKFIKKNKFVIIVIIIFIVTTFILYQAYQLLMPSNGVIYGNRLEGIKEVPIKQDLINEINKSLQEKEAVSTSEINIIGKTVNIIITVEDDTNIKTAKDVGNITLEHFEEKQLKYYDFQVFIKKKDSTQNNFPIIGYKHAQKDIYIWTKDREVIQWKRSYI